MGMGGDTSQGLCATGVSRAIQSACGISVHTSTRLGIIYGHTAITLGDGHSSASDFIERDTLAGARSRTGLRIFEPIN